MSVYKNFGMFAILSMSVLLVSGCGSEKPDSEKAADATSTSVATHDNHSGWWCTPHGIPESECSMCSKKYASECKEKGDWCVKHNRAQSQCFICDPSLAEKFAKLYEAKYGKKPPAAIE